MEPDEAARMADATAALTMRLINQLQEWNVPCDRVACVALVMAAVRTLPHDRQPEDVVQFLGLCAKLAGPGMIEVHTAIIELPRDDEAGSN
jgi:hypothetical protein